LSKRDSRLGAMKIVHLIKNELAKIARNQRTRLTIMTCGTQKFNTQYQESPLHNFVYHWQWKPVQKRQEIFSLPCVYTKSKEK